MDAPQSRLFDISDRLLDSPTDKRKENNKKGTIS